LKSQTQITIAFALLSAATFGAEKRQWPATEEFTKTFSIDFRSRSVLVKVNLRDITGKSQYQLVCFSGDDAANAAAGSFIYSDGLLCGLGEARAPLMQFMENRSLLSEKAAAIYSRGSIHPSALVGPCANYPDFGAQAFDCGECP
jgi:hypothetical protein